MKPSKLEIRRVQAQESVAESITAIVEQLARIEAKLDQLLEKNETESAPPAKKGRGE